MKNFPDAISTLSPVRRVTTFFAFLGFLTLASCQDDQESMVDLLDQQTEIFHEMAGLLDQAREGGNPDQLAKSLTSLGEELKELKIKTAASEHPELASDGAVLPQQTAFLEATAAFQQAQQKAFMAGKITPEINRAIMAHHNSAPMPGEGTPQ